MSEKKPVILHVGECNLGDDIPEILVDEFNRLGRTSYEHVFFYQFASDNGLDIHGRVVPTGDNIDSVITELSKQGKSVDMVLIDSNVNESNQTNSPAYQMADRNYLVVEIGVDHFFRQRVLIDNRSDFGIGLPANSKAELVLTIEKISSIETAFNGQITAIEDDGKKYMPNDFIHNPERFEKVGSAYKRK